MDIQTLKRSGQFHRVFAQGSRASSGGLLVFCATNHLAQNRYGLVATTKAGPAVKRNKLRRWMREYLRKPTLALSAGWDVIIHAGKPELAGSYSGFIANLETALAGSRIAGEKHVR